MKFWENFGVQAVFKETLPDSNGPECSKPKLFSYKSRESKFRLYPAFPIPGVKEDDGQSPFTNTVGWDWVQESCSHQPSHYSIIIPYQTDHHCLVYLGLFMGCVTPTTQLQEWWTELDPRDAGTASLGAPRHDVVPSIDLFVMDVVPSIFWKEN